MVPRNWKNHALNSDRLQILMNFEVLKTFSLIEIINVSAMTNRLVFTSIKIHILKLPKVLVFRVSVKWEQKTCSRISCIPVWNQVTPSNPHIHDLSILLRNAFNTGSNRTFLKNAVNNESSNCLSFTGLKPFLVPLVPKTSHKIGLQQSNTFSWPQKADQSNYTIRQSFHV